LAGGISPKTWASFRDNKGLGVLGFLDKASSKSLIGSDVNNKLFMLSPRFVIAEYALSYQNTAWNI
jgi:hypothetical protein